MSKEADLLEAESALAKVLARHSGLLWENEKKSLKEALEVLRKEASK